MTVTAEKVVFEAMSLSPQARAFVAERLIESLDASPGEALSTAWRDELRKRCQEMDEGNVELREASDVFAKAHSIRFHPDAEAEMLDVFTHISFWTWVHVDAGWVFRAFPAPKGLCMATTPLKFFASFATFCSTTKWIGTEALKESKGKSTAISLCALRVLLFKIFGGLDRRLRLRLG